MEVNFFWNENRSNHPCHSLYRLRRAKCAESGHKAGSFRGRFSVSVTNQSTNQMQYGLVLQFDKTIFPSIKEIISLIGRADVQTVPIPADCADGFGSAYWARPEAYLN